MINGHGYYYYVYAYNKEEIGRSWRRENKSSQ